MFSLALLLSSFSLPPIPMESTALPDQLMQARALTWSQPEQCRQMANAYLLRNPPDAAQPALSGVQVNYRDNGERYRNRQQSLEALLIEANCLSMLNQSDEAMTLLQQVITQARKQHLPVQEASALYQLQRLVLLSALQPTARDNYLPALQQLLDQRQLADSLLPLYVQLLRTAWAINNGDNQAALQALQALQHATPESAPPDVQIALLSLQADFYHQRGQDDMALSLYSDALALAHRSQQPWPQAQLADTISRLFEHQGDLLQSLRYSEQACDQYQQLGNSEWLARGLTRLAGLYRQTGDANMALSLLFNALDIFRNINRPEALADLNLQVGMTYMQMHNLNAARSYLVAARNSYLLNHNKSGELSAVRALGELYLQQKSPGLTIALLENTRRDLPAQQVTPELFLLLSQAYESKGDYRTAFDYLKAFADASREQNQQNRQQGEVQFREKLDQATLERTRDELRQQKDMVANEQIYYQSAIGSAALLLFSAALWMWRLQRRQRLAHQHVEQLEQRLSRSPLSNLPNQHQLALSLDQLDDQLAAVIHADEDLPAELQLNMLHVSLPALRRLCERLGQEGAERLQREFSQQLAQYLDSDTRIYQLDESRLLLVLPGEADPPHSASGQATVWLDRLETLLADLQLLPCVLMGVVSYPFLSRCPEAVTGPHVVELSLIALAAAGQIVEKTHRSSWVELSAIDCQQAAFFNGVFRSQALLAIDKGLVKVNALHNKNLIDWSSVE